MGLGDNDSDPCGHITISDDEETPKHVKDRISEEVAQWNAYVDECFRRDKVPTTGDFKRYLGCQGNTRRKLQDWLRERRGKRIRRCLEASCTGHFVGKKAGDEYQGRCDECGMVLPASLFSMGNQEKRADGMHIFSSHLASGELGKRAIKSMGTNRKRGDRAENVYDVVDISIDEYGRFDHLVVEGA